MLSKRYRAKPGTRFSNRDAKIIGAAIDSLPKEKLNPRGVLESAKVKTSPLHPYFEWNDKIAGLKYRLQQARRLLVSVEVVLTPDNGPAEVMAQVVSLETTRGSDTQRKPREYYHIETVLQKPDLLERLVDQCQVELQEVKARYQEAMRRKQFRQKFNAVFSAIAKLQSKLPTRRRAA